MSEHFIKNIEIKEYKLFNDFKAEGFGRVNLIGGKNNVGKTAFMEACYIVYTASKYNRKDENREKRYLEIIKSLLQIELSRNNIEFIKDWINNKFNFKNITNFEIELIKNFAIYCEEGYITPETIKEKPSPWNYGTLNIREYKKNKYFYEIFDEKDLPKLNIFNFLSPCIINHQTLVNLIDDLKLNGKIDLLKNYLNVTFKIKEIDVIKNRVMLKQDSIYIDLNQFGDGLKSFIHIIASIMLLENYIIFIDEIENGIHYTNLDKLWEMILTLSKEQNVQVFATTHSKECIESYARVAKKLEDKEIAFIELCKRDKEIKSFVYPYDWFLDEIEQEHEVRGCL